MPCYSYFCDKCQTKFEISCGIKDYDSTKPRKCIKCRSSKFTYRLYSEDLGSLYSAVKKSDSELKTLGDLANRNRDKISDDNKMELNTKHSSYKDNLSQKQLPAGMSRIKTNKNNKIKWTNK